MCEGCVCERGCKSNKGQMMETENYKKVAYHLCALWDFNNIDTKLRNAPAHTSKARLFKQTKTVGKYFPRNVFDMKAN